jgi:transcriptional regulator with XRE-family HTH domain
MFYPASTKFSPREDQLFAREDFVYNVTEDILVAMEKQNISKSELAQRLGKSKAYVSQILSGSRNMTLGTLSDIAFVLNLTLKIQLSDGARRGASAPAPLRTAAG